jgi:ribosomal protein S8E
MNIIVIIMQRIRKNGQPIERIRKRRKEMMGRDVHIDII